MHYINNLYNFLRGLVNEVGTAIRNHNGYIYIPDLGKKLEALETA